MIKSKLAIIAPTYWLTWEIAKKKARLFLASLDKAGVRPAQFCPYGIGSTYYHGTAEMRIYELIPFLDELKDRFSHVLFMDAWDMLMVRPLDDVVTEYERYGSPPMLTGAAPPSFGIGDVHEPELYADMYDLTKPFPFPTFFYIGELKHCQSQLMKIPKGHHNESYALVEAFRKGLEFVTDHECRIFQEGGIHHGGQGTGVEIRNGRVYNAITGSQPCTVHFGGGYVNPETGKDEQIEPWAKELGII